MPIDYVGAARGHRPGRQRTRPRTGGPGAGAPGGAGAADRPRLPRRARRLAATGGGVDHPHHPRRDHPAGVRHRAGDRRQRGRRRRRRRPAPRSASATCRGRPRRSAAAPPRSPATSSANASWASRASTPPTAACRSNRSSATRARTAWAGLRPRRVSGRRGLRRAERPAVRGQAVFVHQRRHPVAQHVPVSGRQVGSAPVQLAGTRPPARGAIAPARP